MTHLQITEVSPRRSPDVPDLAGASSTASDFRPWLDAVGERLDLEGDVLEAIATRLDAPRISSDSHADAARLGLEIADELSTTQRTETAVAAGLFALRLQGFEAGQSPARHWRLNRLLNAGSRAVDLLVRGDRFRRIGIEALFYRILNQALGGPAEVTARGIVAETSCAVDWNEEAHRPWRRELPPKTTGDAELQSAVVDWLLEEFLGRGFSSLTLGSVVAEQSSSERSHELDDALADWLGELPADEACLVTGVLFGPARIGGWDRPDDDRLFDAFAAAKNVVDDIAFDESKAEIYLKHLEQIDGLRRVPAELSPTFELRAGDENWRARWGVSVYPVRRKADSKKGYFAIEAGLYFDDSQREVSSWSDLQKRRVMQDLKKRVAEADDEAYGRFSGLLDDAVEAFNTAPAVVDTAGGDAAGPSPLWEGLEDGIVELSDAADTDKIDELAEALRRWTFRVASP